MDLSKGGLAASTPTAASKPDPTRPNSRHFQQSNSNTSKPTPPLFSVPTNTRKRKSEVVSEVTKEREMGKGGESNKQQSKSSSLKERLAAFKSQTPAPREHSFKNQKENNKRFRTPAPPTTSNFISVVDKQHDSQVTPSKRSRISETSFSPSYNAFAARNDTQEQFLDNIESTAQQNDILVNETQESAPEYWGTRDEFDRIGRMTQQEEEEQKLDSYDNSHHVADNAYLSPRRLSSSSPNAETDLYDDMTPQNEPLDDKNDTPEITSPDVTQRRSKSPEVSAETRDAQAIKQLGSIPALFPGPNPFLQYAKALARSKGRLPNNNEGTGQTTAELIEKSRKDGLELTNRLTGILQKTNNLFCRIGARQAEVRARLDEHSKKLDDEGKQIEETKKTLGEWSGQLLQEGGVGKDNA